MRYQFVSEEQFNAWARQIYAHEFVFVFDNWNDIFETDDLEMENMTDWIEVNGSVVTSPSWYPFNRGDIGHRIVEVQ